MRMRTSPGYNSTSVSPGRSPKSQIDSSSYEGGLHVLSRCRRAKPRADRRADGRVSVPVENPRASVGSELLCSFRLVDDYSPVIVPMLLHRRWLQLGSGSNTPTPCSLHSFLCCYVTESDCRTSFSEVLLFHITSLLSQNLTRRV